MERGGPSHQTVRNIERGLATTYRPATFVKLDRALAWRDGTVEKILAGTATDEDLGGVFLRATPGGAFGGGPFAGSAYGGGAAGAAEGSTPHNRWEFEFGSLDLETDENGDPTLIGKGTIFVRDEAVVEVLRRFGRPVNLGDSVSFGDAGLTISLKSGHDQGVGRDSASVAEHQPGLSPFGPDPVLLRSVMNVLAYLGPIPKRSDAAEAAFQALVPYFMELTGTSVAYTTGGGVTATSVDPETGEVSTQVLALDEDEDEDQ